MLNPLLFWKKAQMNWKYATGLPVRLSTSIAAALVRACCQEMDADASGAQNKADTLFGKYQAKLIFVFAVFRQLSLNQFAWPVPLVHLLCVCRGELHSYLATRGALQRVMWECIKTAHLLWSKQKRAIRQQNPNLRRRKSWLLSYCQRSWYDHLMSHVLRSFYHLIL